MWNEVKEYLQKRIDWGREESYISICSEKSGAVPTIEIYPRGEKFTD